MSPRKIIFFALIAVAVLGAGIAFSILSSQDGKAGQKGPKELRVWVVGDDVAGYDDIVKDFKSKYDRYKNTEIRITKFANFADYEKTLLNVIADGNSPEVFVVPSDGAGVLESKIEPIPDAYLSTDEFSKRFNRVFDPLITERQEKDEDGKEVTVSELKGVPMGYETMAAFYNLDLVSNAVPRTWSELAKQASESSTVSGDDGESSDSEGSVLVGMGLGGKYVQNAGDLVSLFMVQNGFASYENLSENGSAKALSEYLAYGVPSGSSTGDSTGNGNDLSRFRSEMDKLSITATDLFARGKIGVVFGFPSYLREIQYAVKRASQEASLNKRNLKTTTLPVTDNEKNPANLARFQYFALSKYAKDQQGGLEFILHLADAKSQESYMEKFPYVLPALNELVEKRKEQTMSKEYPRIKYESFLPVQNAKSVAYDKGLSSEYDAYFKALGDSGKDSKKIVTELSELIKCQRRHLIEGANFEEACPTY